MGTKKPSSPQSKEVSLENKTSGIPVEKNEVANEFNWFFSTIGKKIQSAILKLPSNEKYIRNNLLEASSKIPATSL